MPDDLRVCSLNAILHLAKSMEYSIMYGVGTMSPVLRMKYDR